MCEQCLVNPLYFGEPLPGWILIRARRNGNMMEAGEWGLVQCNDPTLVWKTTPKPNPIAGMTDDEEDAYFAVEGRFLEHAQRYEEFEQACLRDLSVYQCYKLVAACIDAGFRREDGDPVGWLFDHLGDWIAKTEPVTEDDPFPSDPTDTTIWKD